MTLRLAPHRTARTRSSHPRRPVAAAPSSTARVVRAGGPEDTALYVCGCGRTFYAAVSTGVDCPRCGTGQAW